LKRRVGGYLLSENSVHGIQWTVVSHYLRVRNIAAGKDEIGRTHIRNGQVG
jgi:hypothetical protein